MGLREIFFGTPCSIAQHSEIVITFSLVFHNMVKLQNEHASIIADYNEFV